MDNINKKENKKTPDIKARGQKPHLVVSV